MAPQPPSFGSQQYWDARFTSNSSPFEWLEAPTALDPYLVAALKATEEERPEILHIGCGTSLLSYHLRAHVKDPDTITNLDYSDVAIRVGKKREVDIYSLGEGQEDDFGFGSTSGALTSMADSERKSPETGNGSNVGPSKIGTSSNSQYMRWSAANLLSHTSLLDACKPHTYSVIVDKSTSDSIACSEDVYVPLPYHIGKTSDEHPSSRLSQSSEPIHPLHILAIHLALLAKAQARWISLSYSEDRYPFLHQPIPTFNKPSTTSPITPPEAPAEQEDEDGFDDDLDDDLDDIPREIIDNGLPEPSTLWELEAKYEIEVPSPPAPSGSEVIHRPKVPHWVYVLRRTDVGVFVRER
jgi:hypothetical protein